MLGSHRRKHGVSTRVGNARGCMLADRHITPSPRGLSSRVLGNAQPARNLRRSSRRLRLADRAETRHAPPHFSVNSRQRPNVATTGRVRRAAVRAEFSGQRSSLPDRGFVAVLAQAAARAATPGATAVPAAADPPAIDPTTGEIASLRTRTTRTFVRSDGDYETGHAPGCIPSEERASTFSVDLR
jgi:hypothetical protein